MQRLIYLVLTLVLFSLEVLIALYMDDQFVRPLLGDGLVVILIYCFVRIFIPSGVRWLPLYVFLFACFIEFLQYINIVEILGLSGNRVARTVIGTSFDWRDIVCYGIGCLIVVLISAFYKKIAKKKF